MSDEKLALKKELRELEEKEETLRASYKKFFKEIEEHDAIRRQQVQKSDEMLEAAHGDPKLASILEEKNDVLQQMKEASAKYADEADHEFKKSLNEITAKRDIITKKLESEEDERK